VKSLVAKLLTATVLAGGALAASTAFAGKAPPFFDFKIFESESDGSACTSVFGSAGTCGTFVVHNNTLTAEGISITGFRVGNPDATDVLAPAGWLGAIIGPMSFPGVVDTQLAFAYTAITAADYIDGGEARNDFYWQATQPGSPWIVDFKNAAGQTGSCSATDVGDFFGCYASFAVTEAPEPATMALLGGGLLALGAIRRRRKV
jgi:hypothetical protein